MRMKRGLPTQITSIGGISRLWLIGPGIVRLMLGGYHEKACIARVRRSGGVRAADHGFADLHLCGRQEEGSSSPEDSGTEGNQPERSEQPVSPRSGGSPDAAGDLQLCAGWRWRRQEGREKEEELSRSSERSRSST